MISYQWADSAAAELLHEELALRGFVVYHDRCTFPAGSRIGSNMDEAVAASDGFVAYLTPHSLYENAPAGTARPAIDSEFKPAMDRLARSRAQGGVSRPVIVPLTHGLGDPRSEAPERVRRATGKDISTLWTPVVLNQDTESINQGEAAAVGKSLLAGLLVPGGDNRDSTAPLELLVVTRGEGQSPSFLSIDGTSLLGGQENRPGTPEAWSRYLAALRDVQSILASWTQNREMVLRIKAHLSAAIAFGRVFNQAAGWRLNVEGRHGPVASTGEGDAPELHTSLDKGAKSEDLSVEIDLLGVKVSEVASATLANLAAPATNRLCVWREQPWQDLLPEAVAAMSSKAATAVRDAVFDLRPPRVHLFCAAPVEFAVLLGTRLTSMHADLHLYERAGDGYEASMVVPRSV